MTLTSLQEATLDQIARRRKGREITGAEVARAIRLTPRSEKEGADMRSIIHALRLKGYPICANNKGYYWPETPTELDEYLEDFKARIEDQQKAYYGMQANAEYIPAEIVEI